MSVKTVFVAIEHGIEEIPSEAKKLLGYLEGDIVKLARWIESELPSSSALIQKGLQLGEQALTTFVTNKAAGIEDVIAHTQAFTWLSDELNALGITTASSAGDASGGMTGSRTLAGIFLGLVTKGIGAATTAIGNEVTTIENEITAPPASPAA